jgi:DNA ligase (NAD+)
MLSRAKQLDERSFRKLLLDLADRYENIGSGSEEASESSESSSHTRPQVSDDLFDLLVKLYENKFDQKFTEVGSLHTGKGVDVKLPYPMHSLDKAKGETAQKDLDTFLRRHPESYLIADKLDGNSAEYIVKHRAGKVERFLYTRGDGTTGKDISKIIPYLNLPVPKDDMVVRGEIVFPRKAFERYVKRQKELGNPRKLNNSRNVANGIILAGDSFSPKACRNLQFVPFNILSATYLNQEAQYAKLEKKGFIPPWFLKTDDIRIKSLTRLLEKRRKVTLWDIDGLVITANTVTKFPLDGNPTHQFAFKVDTLVTTTVTDVIWKASKDGLLKPVAHFDAVFVGGADVGKAYIHNAKYCVDEMIGPGAIILITRSGEVIPHVVEVLKGAKKPKLPTYRKREYMWNKTGVDFVLLDPDTDPNVKQSRLKYFAKHMGIDNLGPGRIAALYDIGIESVSQLIEADIETMATADKLGDKSATTIYNNVHAKITNAPLATVMTASGVFGFGFGLTRCKKIVDAYPNILDYAGAKQGKVSKMLIKLGGFNKMADLFETNLPRFKAWLDVHPLVVIAEHKSKKKIKGPLYNEFIVFTGFTDSLLNNQVEAIGGVVTPTYKVGTTILVVKNLGSATAKVKKAEQEGVKIYSLKDFVKKYNLTTTKL